MHKTTVQLFVTCLIDSLFPETGEAVVEVLNHAGCEVHFRSAQTCCGQPAYNAGYWDDARIMAERTLQVFSDLTDPLIIPSGSCAHMIRHGYPELFKHDPALLSQALALAERTLELSEFLADRGTWAPMHEPPAQRLAYHPSCHLLRGLEVTEQPLRLLEAAGIDNITQLSPECCGFGGIFAIDHSIISHEMVQRRIDEIEALEVDGIVGCDVSCLMNIEGALRRKGLQARCVHIATILAGREIGLR